MSLYRAVCKRDGTALFEYEGEKHEVVTHKKVNLIEATSDHDTPSHLDRVYCPDSKHPNDGLVFEADIDWRLV